MRPKEVITSARMAASPEYASRRIQGATPYETPLDAKLVTSFLSNKKIRLPYIVCLNADKENALSQRERVGLLYFNALIMSADSAIDTSPEFAVPMERSELAIRLMAQPVWDTGLTLAELTRCTLDHFPAPKRKVITSYLESMADINADRGRMQVGEYSYNEARMYRDATDLAWVEATAGLIDSTADPVRIEKYKRYGLLAQHVDDMWDCVDDAQEGTQNLFLGLAGDMAHDHPEELEAFRAYVATPKASRPQQSLKSWIRQNMPHTRAAYADKYSELLTSSRGLTRTIFRAAQKTI